MTFKVTLEDVSLKDFTLSRLPLIDKLRKQHFASETTVCIERAKLITEYMKRNDSVGKSASVLRAEAVAHYMSGRKAQFHNDNLIAGGTSSKPIGAPLYPELLGLTIWPELETISHRAVNPQKLSSRDAEICNLDIFPYWMDRSVLEVTRKQFNNPKCLRLMERVVFFINGKAGCISHCVPGFEAVLHRGLDALMAEAADRLADVQRRPLNDDRRAQIEFYQSVQIALSGINAYAAKLAQKATELAQGESDPDRQRNLEAMAAVCRRVPENPARTFREAVNALWLCQVGIHAENINMAMSPGRLDQVLYPFFQRDVEENGLTIKDTLELGCCLWLKIADNTNLVPETAEKLWGGAGSTPAVTLGGIDSNGQDAVNDLTYIFLKVTELMALRDPSVNARYHYELNDKRYRQRVCEVIVHTRAIPAFHNDVADIDTLVNQGVEEKHARDFGIVGCVELASSGRDYVSSSSIMLNLSSAMEMTLLNGKRLITGEEQIGPESGDPTEFSSFNQFWEAFKAQLSFVIEQAVTLNDHLGIVHRQMLPTPLLSAFFEGPMQSGRDLIFGGALYNSSGASHVAFPDVCDSLNAIEQGVFTDKRFSMEEMVNAVKSNFASPYDQYLPYLKNRAPKFGTEHPVALKNSKNLVRFIYETYQGHTNYRGGTYRPAYWTMTTHAGQGRLAGALPSGRKAHEVFSSGITPASQAAQNLTEAFNAIADLPGKTIPGGQALNIKYTPMATGQGNREYVLRFGEFVEAYFRNGGLQVQFNVQDYETLIDAKAHPEKYPEMIVRVSGYSAYFNDLNEAMKNELITRTQYDLFNGQAVPLPGSWKGV